MSLRKKRNNSNNTNNKGEPTRKRQRKNSEKNVLAIDEITSFSKNFIIQGFIAEISDTRVNKTSNNKYKLVVIWQKKNNGNILSFRIYCYGVCLSKVNKMKRHEWVEAVIPKVYKPSRMIPTTCPYITSIGGKVQGGIIKIKSRAMEIVIPNLSKGVLNNLAENQMVSFAGKVIEISAPQPRKTKFGAKTITYLNVNVNNALDLPVERWNLPKGDIKVNDVIQCTQAKKTVFNGRTSVVMLQYLLNANNKQCKAIKKMTLKPRAELESFGIDLEKEYENAQVYRVKRIRELQKELQLANINHDKKQLIKQFEFERIKVVPDSIEHLPMSEEYWGDTTNRNQKLKQIGNKFYNKKNKLVTDKKLVYKTVLFAKDNAIDIGSIEITLWDDTSEKFYGISAQTFSEMDTIEKVNLFDEICENRYEFWIQIKINNYKNKTTFNFMVEDVKIANDDESVYEFVEPINDGDESECEDDALFNECEQNATYSDIEDECEVLTEDEE